MTGSHKRDDAADRALTSIRRIIRRVASHSRALLRTTGLTMPQLLCMRAIRDLDEVTVAGVADEVHLSRSTVSGVVERLVQAGLVHRARSTVDRRRVHLSLTELGTAQLDEMPAPLQDRFVDRLSALPAAEREALLTSLETVVALMDAEDVDAAPMLVSHLDLSR